MVLFGLEPEPAWLLEVREFRALARAHEAREKAADYRAGILAALVYNAHRAADKEALTVSDFFPSLTPPEPEPTPESDGEFMRALVFGLGGKVVTRSDA